MAKIEDAVARGNFVIHPKGVSMWPMIRHGKDSVVINPVSGRLKKYDIPLYKDRLDRYVVHRVIEVNDEGYVICGDGLFEKEYDITDENVIGVVTGFFRKEKYISADDKKYLRYVRFWVDNFYLRKPVIKLVRKIRNGKYYLKTAIKRIIRGKKKP
ncbi:MAG: S24/S26 family peptidase [Clostridia bacterium]|nr:S24/S26 family peptidase [Clostridia bacterium]